MFTIWYSMSVKRVSFHGQLSGPHLHGEVGSRRLPLPSSSLSQPYRQALQPPGSGDAMPRHGTLPGTRLRLRPRPFQSLLEVPRPFVLARQLHWRPVQDRFTEAIQFPFRMVGYGLLSCPHMPRE